MFRSGFISLLIFSSAVLLARDAGAVPLRITSQAKVLTAIAQTDPPAKGQITPHVACAANPQQSYALYLPSNYSAARKWPVLYAFDPGARGRIPVERFREAAEKYGWIVAGSNNSRNGPLQSSVDAFNAVWNDTHERLAIDQGRAYTTGMSGGARVAVMLATLCSDCVAGVIGCGAGFPIGVAPARTMRFGYFGAVGVDDFNFPEVTTLEEALQKAGIAHRIRVFDGRHEWLPATTATEAIEWMELQAVKTGKARRDESLINQLWQKYSAAAKALEAANKNLEAYQLFASWLEVFKGLHDTSEAEKHAGQLRDSRAVKDGLREERQQIAKQQENEQQIYALIAASTADDAFDAGRRLRNTIAELQKSAKAESDSSARRVARRVTEGLFIGLLEQSRSLLQEKKYEQAVTKLELATEVAPERPGAFFSLAQAQALSGNRKKSLQALQNAVDKGFSDLDALTNNKAFDSLRNEPLYQQIVKALHSKN